MANGKDKKWIEDSVKFVNPYNFVSLGQGPERRTSSKNELTGVIKCRLTTATPLGIPDAANRTKDNDINDHYSYPFFKIGDKPAIPGSELRGMIRSVYETLSDSCFSVNNNNILASRHTFPRLPGVVRWNGEWELYNASVRKIDSKSPLQKDEIKRIWYDIHRKKVITFAFKIGQKTNYRNLENAVTDYYENLNCYEENLEKGTKQFELYQNSTKGIKKDGKYYPVYYETIGSGMNARVYLSPAQISRSVYGHRLNDLLKGYKSCSATLDTLLKSREDAKNKAINVCKACDLFGYISRFSSQGSKVRFSDAYADNFISMGYKTLCELAGPKITAVEFYTHRPKGSLSWNYDQKTIRYEKKRIGTRNITIPIKEPAEISIRGRKFYLHDTMTDNSHYETNEKTKRNSTLELADKGSTFSFDVFFENISEEQLKELVWTLCLGENKTDSTKMFKLGHGKPLGLGSVKITVDTVKIRKFDLKEGYAIKSLDINELIDKIPFDTDSDYFKEMMLIANSNTTSGMNISYPVAEDFTAKADSKNKASSHQWFAGNRTIGIGGTSTAWNYGYTLPRIGELLELPRLVKVEKDSASPTVIASSDTLPSPVQKVYEKFVPEKGREYIGLFLQPVNSKKPKIKVRIDNEGKRINANVLCSADDISRLTDKKTEVVLECTGFDNDIPQWKMKGLR